MGIRMPSHVNVTFLSFRKMWPNYEACTAKPTYRQYSTQQTIAWQADVCCCPAFERGKFVSVTDTRHAVTHPFIKLS